MPWDVKIFILNTKTVIPNSFQDLFNGNFRLFVPKKSKKQVSDAKKVDGKRRRDKNLPYFTAGRIYLICAPKIPKLP